MKKSTDILKKIDPAHLAGPLLNATFRKDAAEMDRILACVPRQAVLSPHTSYLFTREFLEGRLLLLGLEYWRSLAFASNVTGEILASSPKRPASEIFELDNEHRQWRRWGLLLDCLLSNMCEIAGLDEPATRAFLSLPDPDPTPLTAEEQHQLAERVAEFKTALSEAGRGV